LDPADIRRLDHAHVWHPYAPAHTTNLPVTATDGIHLRLADGRRVIRRHELLVGRRPRSRSAG